MDDLGPITDVLTIPSMPKLAAAMRERRERILTRWDALVRELLPDADALTIRQVRNSIPGILDQMAKALEADEAAPTEQLMEMTKTHGAVRFHESYNIEELIAEYRILRRVLVEEIDNAFSGVVSTREWIALDVAVDIAMQQAVLSFLQHQSAQIRSAALAETKFLSFLSHDLRNGLNNILLMMQWVEQSLRPDPKWAEHVDGLRSARTSATETIDSMERLLQAERLRKQVTAKREPVQLKAVADSVIAQYEETAHDKNCTLIAALPENAVVLSDAGLLTVILQNLLSNAIKYSNGGKILIEAHPQPESKWLLQVKDHGKGIAPELLSKLFDAFTRGETHGQPGVGLGLHIAAQAAQALHTKISIDSTLGKGSTFSLLLPATQQ